MVNSTPMLAVYISSLELDRDRLADATYVGKLHIRERDINNTDSYTNGQGRNYTVERLMPTPFKLSMKIDIWSANTDQKLQLLEQILVLFNPSLELQTSDNYIDWTSLSVLYLNSVNWSSRSVPSGIDSPIDIATLTLDAPIWISPPVKVKHLGVITKIITSVFSSVTADAGSAIDGLGETGSYQSYSFADSFPLIYTTISQYNIDVYNDQIILLHTAQPVVNTTTGLPAPIGQAINWIELFSQSPGEYIAGSSMIYLTQANGVDIAGAIAINPLDNTIISVDWNLRTLNTNTGIDSSGRLDSDLDYNNGTNYRLRSPGTFDAIIDPLTVGPGNGINNLVSGDRFLIIEDIGNIANQTGAVSWKNADNSDFIAKANDIIEWTGLQWNVIFDALNEPDTLIYQTNIYTGIQYVWNGVAWSKSFEGEYKAGTWRLEL